MMPTTPVAALSGTVQAMTTQKAKGSAISSWSHAELRERVLASGARALAGTRRALWYAETLVLSARYQQWLTSQPWASGCPRFGTRVALWEGAVLQRLRHQAFVGMEFGVANGHATRWWAEHTSGVQAWHGFDTFSGLPSAWERGGVSVMQAGVFTPDGGKGSTPSVPAGFPVTWHVGLIDETLVSFPDRPSPAPLLILIDVDLEAPTRTILRWALQHARRGDIIYFDEAFDPWNEGRALREALRDGLSIKALGHTGSALAVEVQ